MKFAISLSKLIHLYPKNSKYEPEIFPGVVYRLADPKMVLLIFASGKIVFTGGKEINQINIFQANFINWKPGISLENNIHCIIFLQQSQREVTYERRKKYTDCIFAESVFFCFCIGWRYCHR